MTIIIHKSELVFVGSHGSTAQCLIACYVGDRVEFHPTQRQLLQIADSGESKLRCPGSPMIDIQSFIPFFSLV